MNGVDVFSQMSLILSQLQAVSMPNVGGSTGGNQQSFESMMSDKRAESDASSTTPQKPENGQNTQTKPTTDQGKTEDATVTQPEQPLSDEELELRMALLGGMNPYSISLQNVMPAEVQVQADGLVEVCATGQQSVAEVEQVVAGAPEAGQNTQPIVPMESQQEVSAAEVSEQPQEQTVTQETVETTETLEQQGLQTTGKAQMQEQADGQQDDSTQKDNNGTTDVQVTTGNTKAPERETEQTMIKVGDGDTLDATEPEFDTKLAKQIETALDRGQQKVTVQLTPEHLGKITIEMSKNDNGLLNVVLRTENEHTAHLLREQTSVLSNLLQHGGQDEVRVQVAQPQEAETQWKQPDQEQNGHNQQSQQQQKGKRDETEQFLQQLRLGLLTQSEEE